MEKNNYSFRLSIITINLNNAEGLEKTILSVINQTSSIRVEYIIIDGGSTDNSVSVLEKYKNSIDYSVSETDKGIYNAMNKGIAKASGDYLLFINSGDTLLNSNAIDCLINKSGSLDLVYGNILLLQDNIAVREVVFPSKLSFSFFYINSLPHCGTIIKRSLFTTIGLYREDFQVVSDWAFFMLAINKFNCTYTHVPVTVASFVLGGISSKEQEIIKKEREQVLFEYFPSFIDDYKQLFLLSDELSKTRKQIGYRVHQKLEKLFS